MAANVVAQMAMRSSSSAYRQQSYQFNSNRDNHDHSNTSSPGMSMGTPDSNGLGTFQPEVELQRLRLQLKTEAGLGSTPSPSTPARNDGDSDDDSPTAVYVLQHHRQGVLEIEEPSRASVSCGSMICDWSYDSCLPASVQTVRQQIYDFLDDGSSSTLAGYWSWFMITVIILSIIMVILSSIAKIDMRFETALLFVEMFVVAIFSFDYLLRLLCTSKPIAFFWSPLNLIDLLSVIPFFIELSLDVGSAQLSGLTALRVVRLLRIVRLVKAGRHSTMMQTFVQAVANGRDGIFFLVFLLTICSVLFGTVIFYAETAPCDLVGWVQDENRTVVHDDRGLPVTVNPFNATDMERFSHSNVMYVWVYTDNRPVDDLLAGEPTQFQSIPRAMWWCLVTLTTVGYGDMYPVTDIGKLFASVAMVVALVAIAFPVTVLGQAFSMVAQEFKARDKKQVRANISRSGMQKPSNETLKELTEEISQTLHRLDSLSELRRRLQMHVAKLRLMNDPQVVRTLAGGRRRVTKAQSRADIMEVLEKANNSPPAPMASTSAILETETPTGRDSVTLRTAATQGSVRSCWDWRWDTCLPSSVNDFRSAVYDFLDNPTSSPQATMWSWGMIIVIVFSIMLVLLGSVSSFGIPWADELWIMEAIVVAIFTLDYTVRFACTETPISFFWGPLNLIDLLSILPFYVEVALTATGGNATQLSGLTALRVVRLLRVIRLIKAGRHSLMMQTFVQAVIRGRDGVLFLVFLLTICSILFGTLVFYAETAVCTLVGWVLDDDNHGGFALMPDTGEIMTVDVDDWKLEHDGSLDGIYLVWVYNDDLITDNILAGQATEFQSIPRSMWWCLVTLTTVGYGDLYPVTWVGKLLACVTMVVALVAIAFPVTVLGNSFIEVAMDFQQRKKSVESVLSTNKLKNTVDDTNLLRLDVEAEIQQTVERLNELTVWRMFHQQIVAKEEIEIPLLGSSAYGMASSLATPSSGPGMDL